MSRVLNIGWYLFKLNSKRRSFVICSLFVALVVLIYLSRNFGLDSAERDSILLIKRIFFYIVQFLGTYIIAYDYKNGMYKTINTSSLRKYQILAYKYFTVTLYGIIYWIFSLIISCFIILGNGGDISSVVINENILSSLLFYILISLNIASFIFMMISITRKYFISMISVFFVYTMVIYVNRWYTFITEKSLFLLQKSSFIILDKWMISSHIQTEQIIIVVVYTVIQSVAALLIQSKRDLF